MVDVFEVDGSPTESWTASTGWKAERVMRCKWLERVAALNQLADSVYPYIDGLTLYVVGAKIDPAPGQQSQGTSSSRATYEDALVTLTYGVPIAGETPLPPGGGPAVEFATESLQGAAEFVTIDPKGLYWKDADEMGLTPEEAPGQLMKTLEYQYSRSNVVLIPAAVLDLVGTVNTAILTPTTPGMTALSFQPETLLYQPPTMSRRLTSEGASLWDLQFRFVYRPNFDTDTGDALGWNHFWKARSRNFFQIQNKDGDVVRPYPLGNFLDILL